MFPESQHTEAVFQRRPKLHLALLAELGIISIGTGFEGPKGSWKAAEDWHCKRPEEAIGGGTASVSVGGPGCRGPAENLRLGRAPRRCNWLKRSPAAAEDPSILEMPVPWDNHEEQQWL